MRKNLRVINSYKLFTSNTPIPEQDLHDGQNYPVQHDLDAEDLDDDSQQAGLADFLLGSGPRTLLQPMIVRLAFFLPGFRYFNTKNTTCMLFKRCVQISYFKISAVTHPEST